MLLDNVYRIVGSRELLDEFRREDEGMVALLMGEKRGGGLCNRVMEEVGECEEYWLDRWWQRRMQLLYG